MTTRTMMHLLPVEAYTSEEWFEREQAAIFSRTWRFAGFVEDVADPGQYVTVQAGRNNIFVIMDDDRRLRAFHNICRHRGTQLLRAIGKTKHAITCPYHDWTYNLDGELRSVPEEAEEFRDLDKSCLGLKPASVDSWRGMLFVHPEPTVGPVGEWFAPIEPHLGPHRVEELVEYAPAASSWTIRANWKIVVENFVDVYHLAHLHENTLTSHDHARARFAWHGPHWSFFGPPTESYARNIESLAPMPLVVPKDRLGAWAPMLFPGLGLSETETDWTTFHVVPLGPDSTRVDTRTRVKDASYWEFFKRYWKSAGSWSGTPTGKYPATDGQGGDDPLTSGDLMAEDIYVCEQQQRSLSSPFFEVGPAAEDAESPVLRHQQIVLSYLDDHR